MGHFWGGASTPGQPVFKTEIDNQDIPDSQGERCRWLWAAVFYQAIIEYRQGRSPYLRKWIEEVRGTFDALCKILKINPVAARERLLAEQPTRSGNKVRKERSDRRDRRSYANRGQHGRAMHA